MKEIFIFLVMNHLGWKKLKMKVGHLRWRCRELFDCISHFCDNYMNINTLITTILSCQITEQVCDLLRLKLSRTFCANNHTLLYKR